MKKFYQLFAFVLPLLMGACTSDEMAESVMTEENEITEIAAISLPFDLEGTDARTTITMGSTSIDTPVWAEGDTIGIYPSAGGDQLSFPIIDGVGSNKCVFTGGGWALKASTATTTYTYTAYTPFNRNYYMLKDNTALPLSMLGQKQVGNGNSDHLGAYDLQIANGDTPTGGKIEFAFQHKVAAVRMDITAPCAATWKSVTLESTAAFTTKASMNLSLPAPTVTPTAQSNSVTLELENVKTTADNLNIITYMMLLPVDLTGKSLSVKLTDVDDNVYTANATVTNNKTNISAGAARWITAEFAQGSTTTTIPYVTFTADASQIFYMTEYVDDLEYSVNGGEWRPLEATTVTFGGTNGNLRLRGNNWYGTATNSSNYSTIKFLNETPVSCTGDIRTLLDYENYTDVYTGYARFDFLFKDCVQLTTVPTLPATRLAEYCYSGMFEGCISLTEAPILPATTLAESCYSYMFRGCTSLTEAPDLPATILTYGCYSYMFDGCTNLKEAPILSVTRLAKCCYRGMFSGCTSLTEALDLPLTILTDYCYEEMFRGCTSLTEAPDLPATILTDYCYSGMFRDCTNLTEAPDLPATILTNSCYSGMFSGCTSLTEAPDLPATILTNSCYSGMFSGCTSLTEAPDLPATILTDYCYSDMFRDCTNLTEAPILPATTLAGSCYSGMFSGCTNLTEAPDLPATILTIRCYEVMFRGCTSLTEAPDLPATILTDYCYSYMFRDCTNLTEAPDLPATILTNSCYSGMFSGCTSLTEAPDLPATILTNSCYFAMFSDCTSLEEAPTLPATTLADFCYCSMFNGCTNLSHVIMLATDISSASSCFDFWLYNVSPIGTLTKAKDITSLPSIPSGWTVVDYEESNE